ncbi:MAG: 6,7-dimethyl-8-ribityllumazine synthase [Deltaproteobacteria bacterium]|nr:6,7-dimethyl-8-ribityllumazine synthase [Deltaproteobacteria bacterium]
MEGRLSAEGSRFALVVSRFNGLITERLVEGAMDCLVRHGMKEDDSELIRVPGTWEMPVAVRWVLERGEVDAVIALGCVIRGGTPHFDYVAGEVTKGIARLQLDYGVPVTLGVLTTDTIDQAIERAGTKHGNKGFEAALAAIEMVSLARSFQTSSLPDAAG